MQLFFAKNNENGKDVRIFLVKMSNNKINKSKISNLHVSNTLDLTKIELNNVEIDSSCLLEKSKGEKN